MRKPVRKNHPGLGHAVLSVVQQRRSRPVALDLRGLVFISDTSFYLFTSAVRQLRRPARAGRVLDGLIDTGMTRSIVGWRQCVAVLLAAAALESTSTSAFAQTRTIQGKVVDEEGRPVTGATVEAAIVSLADVDFAIQRTDQTWKAVTGEGGGYIISVPRTGGYLVTATKEGLGSDRRKVTVQRSGLGTANLTLWKDRAVTVTTTNCSTGGAITRSKGSALVAGAGAGLVRLTSWLEAVQMHTPGCADFSAFGVDGWPVRELATLVRDVRALVTFLHRVQNQREAGQRIFSIYDRRFTLDELQQAFYGNEPLRPNELLRRGALLHADVGILAQGNLGRYPLVQDGGQRGWQGGSAQWDVGRQLLDAIAPTPAADEGALLWYRAVSAHFFREGNLAELASHLSRGRQIFPQSADLWFDSACLHQELSSPAIQASVRELRANDVGVAVGSRADELQRAERFFRQALALAPDHVGARLRLGHTLGELGRHTDAAAELQRALDARPGGPHEYLAALFLGREQESLARPHEAKQHYQRAANLYPTAQSARLALSRLAQHSGDRAGAQDAVRLLSSSSNPAPSDPWWDFYEAHKEDAEGLMAELRASEW